MLLSLLLLLVGGGFGPPLLGMFAGLVAGGAHASPRTWGRRLSDGAGRVLAASWPGLFWLSALNAVFLVVGSLVVGAALDLAVPDLFVYSLFLMVVTMPLATLAGIASSDPLPLRARGRRSRGIGRAATVSRLIQEGRSSDMVLVRIAEESSSSPTGSCTCSTSPTTRLSSPWIGRGWCPTPHGTR